MRKAEDILRDLAFNKDAPDSTKEALLKNLQKALKESDKGEVIPVESIKRSFLEESKPSRLGSQLSFDLGILDYLPKQKKRG